MRGSGGVAPIRDAAPHRALPYAERYGSFGREFKSSFAVRSPLVQLPARPPAGRGEVAPRPRSKRSACGPVTAVTACGLAICHSWKINASASIVRAPGAGGRSGNAQHATSGRRLPSQGVASSKANKMWLHDLLGALAAALLVHAAQARGPVPQGSPVSLNPPPFATMEQFDAPAPGTGDASGALAFCWQEQPDVGNLAGGCGRRPEIRDNLN